MASGSLLVALCVVALFAVRSEGHGLEDFTGGNTQSTPAMESFFGAKPEAAELPEALDASMPAKPEAASAIPTTTTTTTATTTETNTNPAAPAPRRSVSVAAGVACGVAAVAVVGVAAAVAYVVRARRAGARRESGAVQLGSSA
ncbi:hypothetical protein QOZ80_4BG0334530 [Eleusine coracana subsp. coracana]|nr:hypothetical protein QOZ80_4BG0334530 [Eleusine coracana subsp. coracana]